MRVICKRLLQNGMRWLEEYGLIIPEEDKIDLFDTKEIIAMENEVKEHGYAVDSVHIIAMLVKDEKYRELLYDFLFFPTFSDKEREEFIKKLDNIFYSDEDVVAEIKVSKEYLYAIAKLIKMHDEGEDVMLKIKRSKNGVQLLIADGKTFAVAIGERNGGE